MAVVGWLHPMLTYASGSLIVPVVGTTRGRPTVVANPGEVERVFDVALADLVADGVFHEELWRLPVETAGPAGDRWRPLWFFAARGEMIWAPPPDPDGAALTATQTGHAIAEGLARRAD